MNLKALSTLSLLLATAPLAAALPLRIKIEDFFTSLLATRDVIPHDSVVGFPETVPSGTMGEMMLKWQPKLQVFTGCVPFPAVDADGNVG